MNGWINITSCAGYLAAASLLELGHCKFPALQAGWLCVRSASWGTRGNLPARLEREERYLLLPVFCPFLSASSQ